MGKKEGKSWLTLVKRAFRSPRKGDEKKPCRKRDDYGKEEDEQKKQEKRRWLFRKPANQTHQCEENATCDAMHIDHATSTQAQERVAIAEAAAAVSGQAAFEVARHTGTCGLVREHNAAIAIQTAFRAYLARRALRSLKAIVKLQALVRGHNVRQQAKTTLRCMQALIRAQAQICDERARLSHTGRRKSMFAQALSNDDLWGGHLQDIRRRKSTSRDESYNVEQWDDRRCTLQEVEAMLQSVKEAAFKNEKPSASTFSHQGSGSIGYEGGVGENLKWLDRWMATKQWDDEHRATTDRRDSIKTIEVDTLQPSSKSSANTSKLKCQAHHNRRLSMHSVTSLDRPHLNSFDHQTPGTPSPYKAKPLQMHSASPKYQRGGRSYSTANTPRPYSGSGNCYSTSAPSPLPNYMVATESARAKARPQSTPKQRCSTSERERGGSVKKRLSYPSLQPNDRSYSNNSGLINSLRSPSFRSVYGGPFGIEKETLVSCYTESIGGEISPASTTQIRRWFREWE